MVIALISVDRPLGRWSIKEAAYKALQPDFTLRWKEASFARDTASTSRKPILRIASGLVPGVRFHTSVSHDGDHVIAMVVAEVEDHIAKPLDK